MTRALDRGVRGMKCNLEEVQPVIYAKEEKVRDRLDGGDSGDDDS